MKDNKFTLVLLICNMLLLSSSNTLVMPFLPLYLKTQLQCPAESLYLYTAICYSVTFVVSMVISPVWGKFADIFGKKTMLMRVLVLLAISYLFCAFAKTPLQLCLARAFQGLASGITPAFLGLVSAYSDKDKTGTNLGFIQSSNLIGTILGPIIGGIIAQLFGVRECFLIVLTVVTLLLVVNVIFIHEPKNDNKDNEVKDHTTIKGLLSDPIIQSLCSCIFVNAMVIMMIVPMLSTYVQNLTDNNESIALSGIIFSLSGISGAIAAPLWGRAGTQNGFLRVMHLSVLGAAIFYLIAYAFPDIYIFALIQFLFGACICACAPCVHSITAKHIQKEHHTKAYALIYSFQQLGNLTGPLICSIIICYSSMNRIFLFASASLLLLSIYLLFIQIKRQKKQK